MGLHTWEPKVSETKRALPYNYLTTATRYLGADSTLGLFPLTIGPTAITDSDQARPILI